jgi:hypothetical protein
MTISSNSQMATTELFGRNRERTQGRSEKKKRENKERRTNSSECSN